MQEQAQQAVDCAEKPVRDAGRADGQHDSRGQQRAGRRDLAEVSADRESVCICVKENT